MGTRGFGNYMPESMLQEVFLSMKLFSNFHVQSHFLLPNGITPVLLVVNYGI